MPAVLVEPGFITNPDDEKRLSDPEVLSAVADSIAGAISLFYEATEA